MRSWCVAAALCLAAAGCESRPPPAPPAAPPGPRITAFEPAAAAVFVGERASLTAVFEGDSATIDGVGTVQSGVAVATPPLSRTTAFRLVVRRGTEEVEAHAAVQARYRDRFRALAAAPVGRTGHLAAALGDGRAVVLGGNSSETVLVPDSDTSELFDPVTETLTPGPQLLFTALAGLFTSATELSSGALLVVGGGVNAGPGGSVATQVLDSAGQRFSPAGSAGTARRVDGRLTPLLDGGALLTGGAGLPPIAAAERYDAATGEWRSAGSLLVPRFEHSATLLRDGRVLLAGGIVCCVAIPGGLAETYTTAAEIYDPARGSFAPTGSLHSARGSHAAALLGDGRVLVTGGAGNDPAAPPLGAEIYDPSTGEFAPAGDLAVPRRSHAAVPLTDGRVLVLGGVDPSSSAAVAATELFDPGAAGWGAGPALDPARAGATVTPLAGGKVLIFGGETPDGFPVASVALFE